jgi:hypothetical protein
LILKKLHQFTTKLFWLLAPILKDTFMHTTTHKNPQSLSFFDVTNFIVFKQPSLTLNGEQINTSLLQQPVISKFLVVDKIYFLAIFWFSHFSWLIDELKK